MLTRFKQNIWPTLIDYESAQAAVRRAFKTNCIWAIVSIAAGIAVLFVPAAKTSLDADTIVALVLIACSLGFALIARGVNNMSRTWAIVGLVLATALFLNNLAFGRQIFMTACCAYVLLSFINAVRATSLWARLESLQSAPLVDCEKR